MAKRDISNSLPGPYARVLWANPGYGPACGIGRGGRAGGVSDAYDNGVFIQTNA